MYIKSQVQWHKYRYIRRYFMTVVVKVIFNMPGDSTFDSEMGEWIEPYYAAGNTATPFPESTSFYTLHRTWDTVENATAYINKVTTYSCIDSAVIES